MNDKPKPIGLPFNIDRLLQETTLALMRQPDRTRETEGALAMLQRYRAQNDRAPLPDKDAASPQGEGRQLGAMAAAIDAIAAADAASLPLRTFGPPDISAVEELMRKRVYRGAAGHIANFKIIVGGYSKQTSLFDWIGADGTAAGYVLRRDSPVGIVGSTVSDEFPLLAALHRLGQPVPEPVLVEMDNPAISGSFIVTRRLPGRSIGGPLGPGEDRAFDPSPALAKMLAELHAVPVAELGVPRYSDQPFGRNMLLAHIAYWRDRFHKNRETPSPALDAAVAFLEAEVAAGLQPGVVVHGDPGYYNLLFDDDRLVGVVDWELAHLGSAAWDLTYIKEAVEAFRPHEDFLRLYERYGGIRPPPAALAYYNVFRLLYGGTMCVDGLAMFNRGDVIGLDLVHVLCTMYGRYIQQLPAAIQAFYDLTGKRL